MYAHDWVDISNWWIGAAGLVLTVGALWQAAGAKAAAIEARKAVYQRNAADALSEIVRHAEQLATWVESDRWAEAIVVAREIILRLARDRTEYAQFLGADAARLERIQLSCSSLRRQCKLKSVDPDFRDVLMADTLAIIEELSAILGRIRARVDEEGK